MEIKKTPFSALRERLYAAAAAGTSVMQEDFRLQRAVEAFQPMVEKAKPYEKLYKMCLELTTAKEPAEQLAQCIALADALAVAQSGFQDDSPAEPVPAAPLQNLKTLSYLEAAEWVKTIRVGQSVEDSRLEELYPAAADPRLLSAFLEISGRDSINAEEVAMPFMERYGTALIPLLKQRLDLTNPKSKGRQIYYIFRLAGTAENPYYISVAENDEAPSAARVEAINALGAEPSNAERLLMLYQTGRGKVKEAALTALCRNNSALADKPLEKQLAGGYKEANIEFAALCSRPAAYEFMRKHLDYALNNAVAHNDKLHPTIATAAAMLANKTDVDVEFLQCAEWYKNHKTDRPYLDSVLNGVLIQNIAEHPGDAAYESLICSLYDREPDVFFKSRLCLALRKQPETAFSAFERECIKHPLYVLDLLNYPEHHADGSWVFRSAQHFSSSRIKLFDKLPENLFPMLESLARTAGNDYDQLCKVMKNFHDLLEGEAQKKAAASCRRVVELLLMTHPSMDVFRLLLAVAPGEDHTASLTLFLVNSLRKTGHVPEVWTLLWSLRRRMSSAQVQKATEDALREIAADAHISQKQTVDSIEKINKVLKNAIEGYFDD